MLKCGMPKPVPYIMPIVNFCRENTVFPELWKIVQVVPISKNTNPSEYSDTEAYQYFNYYVKVVPLYKF